MTARRAYHSRYIKPLSLLLAASLFFAAGGGALPAQTAPATAEIPPREFPQWAKDLRRAEIVALGSFPFSWFFTNLFIDLSRSAGHGWDSLYWPWPVKPAAAVEMSSAEYGMSIGAAACLSLVIAVTDYLIVRNRRHYKELRRQQRPPAEAIIEREPLFPVPASPAKNTPPPAPDSEGGTP